MTRSWWEPLISYWLGVAYLRVGESSHGELLFHKILHSPKDLEARVQLGLLAIKTGNLAGAGSWVDGLPARYPAVLYAQALLAQRRGNPQKSLEILDSFADYFAEAGPQDPWQHYRLACWRLKASILESSGKSEEAIAALCRVHERKPADPVAANRLTRLLLQEAYQHYGMGVRPPVQLHGLNVESLLASSKNSQDHERASHLWSLLTLRTDGLVALAQSLPEQWRQLSPWRQVLLRRLLEEKQGEEALRLSRHVEVSCANSMPTYFKRAQFVLLSWHFLRHAWVLAARDSASEALVPTDGACGLRRKNLQEGLTTQEQFQRPGLLRAAKSPDSARKAAAAARPLLNCENISCHRDGSQFRFHIRLEASHKGEAPASFGGLTIHFLDLTSNDLRSNNIESIGTEKNNPRLYLPGDLLWGFSEGGSWGQRPAKCLMIEDVVQNWKPGQQILLEVSLTNELPSLNIAIRAWATWKNPDGSEFSEGDPSWAEALGDQQGISCFFRSVEAVEDNPLGRLQPDDFKALFPEQIGQISSEGIPAFLIRCLKNLSEDKQGEHYSTDPSMSQIRLAAKVGERILLNQPVADASEDFRHEHLGPVLAISAITNTPAPHASSALHIFQSKNTGHTANQHSVGSLIARWSANDNALLGDCAILEASADLLPLKKEDIWLAKASVLFGSGNYKAIFESEMPPTIADLSNLDASILLSSCYTRLALQLLRSGNSRSSLQHVRQAVSTLATIVGEPSEEKCN